MPSLIFMHVHISYGVTFGNKGYKIIWKLEGNGSGRIVVLLEFVEQSLATYMHILEDDDMYHSYRISAISWPYV